MEDIRVALAQIECPVGNTRLSIEKHSRAAAQAAKAGARIICFPETSLSGYPTTDALPHELAQPLEGELGQAMAEVSAEAGILLLAGMVERDRSGVLYNTQLIATPRGLIGGYRKTHIGNSEVHRFSHGDELRVFNYEGVRFGILICYDNHFPEASRTLALRGAEIIFCPYGSPGPCTEEGLAGKRSRWMRYLPARAFDNSVYVVVVNQVSPSRRAAAAESSGAASSLASTGRDTHVDLPEFPGGSMVLNPWGEMIAEPKPLAEDVLVVDLKRAVLQEKRADALQFFTHFRRPELYGELVSPSCARVSPASNIQEQPVATRASGG